MPVLIVYPNAGTGSNTSDARVYRQGVNEAFATIRNGNGTDVDSSVTTTVCAQIQCSSTLNQFSTISRGVFSFDTSLLGSSATVASAILSFYGNSKANSLSAGIPELLVAGVSMGNPAVPAASDYQAVARTRFATGISYSDLNLSGYNDFNLNSFGLANINATGISQFSTQWDWDLDNSFGGTWTVGLSQVYVFIEFADQGGTTNDPKLVINYTLPNTVTNPPTPPNTATKVQKRFYYKVYDSAQRYITTWVSDVISDPSFRSVINGGAAELSVKLARPFDSFGEGFDVSLQNRIELWVADSDNLGNNPNTGTLWDNARWDQDLWDTPIYSFRKLFAGFISGYAPVLEDEDQYVDITILGYTAETSYRILKNSSGNTTITYTSQDPGAIMQDVIDKYRADGGTNLNYIGNSIQTVGVTATYTFQFNTIKECFDKILEFCPAGWFYYIDPAGTVFLRQASISADHVLTIGKEISLLKADKRIENLVNQVFVVGGGNPNLFNIYTRNGSVQTYGKFERKIQDGSVTDNTTADLIAKARLDQFQTPETRTVLRISDNQGENSEIGTNIEDFSIGDTIQIKNLNYGVSSFSYWDQAIWDTSVWDSTLQFSTASVLTIVSLQYFPDYIEVEASSRLPEIARRIEQVNKTLSTQVQQNVPTAPTVRSV